MITRKQARRVLKLTDQVVGPLTKINNQWSYKVWNPELQVWVPEPPASLKIAQYNRKGMQLTLAMTELYLDVSRAIFIKPSDRIDDLLVEFSRAN